MIVAAIPVGFFAGLFGIGGGLISVPFLFFIFDFLNLTNDYTMHLAVGTAFFITIFTSTASVLTHRKHHAVDFGVLKIFGPGNQYVTSAKQFATRYNLSIDLPAGPSELLIYADESSIPKYVASDFLSQTEHGPDSQVILVTTNKQIIKPI